MKKWRVKFADGTARMIAAPDYVKARTAARIANHSGIDSIVLHTSPAEAKRQRAQAIRAARTNPKRRATAGGFVLAARRGTGPVMCYTREMRFSNAVAPVVYKSAADARRVGRRLLSAHARGSLKGYTVTIQPHYKGNPSPRAAEVQAAADRLERFSGHVPRETISVRQKEVRTALVVGELDGVLYSTVRDGVPEKYIHRFRKNSRPLLCASHDGRQLRIVGGRFEFTEAGIEDR